MKDLSPELLAAYASEVSTLAMCIWIERTDGVSYYLTTFDAVVPYSGEDYQPVPGFSASAIVSSTGASVDNLDIQTVLEDVGITDVDIMAGRFDFAAFSVFEVDVEDPGAGANVMRTGTLGEIANGDIQAFVEGRGLMQQLHQQIGRIALPRCHYNLGGPGCNVELAPFTVTGTVSAVTDRRIFTVSSPPAAPQGLFTFTGGDNDGLSMEVKAISGSQVTLVLPMPFDIAIADPYSAYRGCNKLDATCSAVFSNIANFGGLNFIPGNDEYLKYPDAR